MRNGADSVDVKWLRRNFLLILSILILSYLGGLFILANVQGIYIARVSTSFLLRKLIRYDYLYLKVCVYGGYVNKRHWSSQMIVFCILTVTISSTLIAHVCDRITYNYVKDNTFRKNTNNIQSEDQDKQQSQRKSI